MKTKPELSDLDFSHANVLFSSLVTDNNCQEYGHHHQRSHPSINTNIPIIHDTDIVLN
jgi:hypothetical protein